MKTNILALDIGTQSTRAAVVTREGEILGIGQIPHEVESPRPGWAQQRPDDWWSEVGEAARGVLRDTGVAPRSIAAVAACGQMHGPVGIDEEGRVTTDRVQLWCDKRCGEECEELRARADETRLAALSANPINPAWTGLKVRWCRNHEPEAYERARWFLVPKDFINYRLTGVAAADPSEASGSFLWDCERDAYSAELAEAVGVDLEKFAPARASSQVIGEVSEEASRATGVPAGTPVVAGGGDFPVSLLGFGIVGEGRTADVTGTSTLLATHARRPVIHPSVQNLRHVVGGWIPFTILDCGGLAVKWLKDLAGDLAGREATYDELIERAREAPAGSDGLLFYPYPLGERRRENTAARGSWFGISLSHKAPCFIRSVMEGVALAMGRDAGIFRSLGVAVDRVLCVGGGARNELWNEIKATVLGVPLLLAEEPEAGLRGVALLGAAGAGLIDDLAAAALEQRAEGREVRPRPQDAAAYREALARFTRLYDHLLGYWSEEPAPEGGA